MSAKEIRRLLSVTKQQRQQQQEVASSSLQSSGSRISHPFAKYDANHKLICVVCSVIIKNESLWTSHLVSLSHKETLRKLKEIKEKTSKETGDSSSSSRVASATTSTFKPKSILKKESSFNNLEQNTNDKKRSLGIEEEIITSKSTSINVLSGATDNNIKNLIGYVGEEEAKSEEEEEEEEEKVLEQARVKRVKYNDDSLTTTHIIEPISQTSAMSLDSSVSQMSIDDEDASTSKLPSDFFDDTEEQINSSTQETKIVQQESALPADFFDNNSSSHSTKVSATAEIDEQEWINFQKEISKETQISNQISNADDEQIQRDRDEMQEREQEFCLARLEKLKSIANRVKENRDKHMTVDDDNVKVRDDDDDTDDEDDDDFVDGWMDWRAQKIS